MGAEAADLFSNICTMTWAPNNLREMRSFRAIPGSQVTHDEAARAAQEAEARAVFVPALPATSLGCGLNNLL